MSLIRCEAGHYYEPEKHSSCPHCGVRNLESDIGMTVAKVRTQAAPQTPDDIKTVGMAQQRLGMDPVVGWLVCIDGADKGIDYKIKSERNFIGRSERMDIIIRGDNGISRENHAILSFNPKRRIFRILPGEGKSIVYVNNEELVDATELNPYDIIEMSRTRLIFVPLCGEHFWWQEDNYSR